MTTTIILPPKFMQPTIHQTAKTIIEICKNHDWFNSSLVREKMACHFPDTDSALLSAKLQPHLRDLISLGAIKRPTTTQRRNKPYVIIDRQKLQNIQNEGPLREVAVQEKANSDEDEMKIHIQKLEGRIVELEDRLNKFFACFEKAVFIQGDKFESSLITTP